MANVLIAETKQGNFNNLIEIWRRRLELSQTLPAVAIPTLDHHWQTLNWGEYGKWIQSWACLLQKKGLQMGDRVAFYAKTNWQWIVLDTAAICSGLVSVPIYETTAPGELLEILVAQQPIVLFLEDEIQLDQLKNILTQVPSLKLIILKKVQHSLALELPSMEVLNFNRGMDHHPEGGAIIQKASQTLNRQTLACVYHTSGTTGQQKPVPLTHGHLLAEIEQLMRRFDVVFGADDIALSMLPYSHIFGRVEWLCHVVLGCKGFRMEGFDDLSPTLQMARPTMMFTVPRVLEKIHAKIFLHIEHLLPHRRWLIHWALNLPIDLHSTSWRWCLANRLVYRKIKMRLGGNLRYFVCAGAPLSKDLAVFFRRLGIKTIEAYGLTECAGALCATMGEPSEYGTVGKPLDQCEVAITPEGELKIKGPNVFFGSDIQDGWFHTGDLAQWDDNKNLIITGRKKDLIVTAGGKKIAPQKIEKLLLQSRLIDQAVVVGNQRPYAVVLVALDRDYLAQTHHQDPLQIKDQMQKLLHEVNAQLASYETIKKFIILPHPLTPESGDLTLSQKPKRAFIEKKFAPELDQLYAQD